MLKQKYPRSKVEFNKNHIILPQNFPNIIIMVTQTEKRQRFLRNHKVHYLFMPSGVRTLKPHGIPTPISVADFSVAIQTIVQISHQLYVCLLMYNVHSIGNNLITEVESELTEIAHQDQRIKYICSQRLADKL